MKCYICNRVLKDKRQIKNRLAEAPIHVEHILQNALRGRLASKDILCEECGCILNETIDAGFISYFAPITELLRDSLIRKEHGKSNAPTTRVYSQIVVNCIS